MLQPFLIFSSTFYKVGSVHYGGQRGLANRECLSEQSQKGKKNFKLKTLKFWLKVSPKSLTFYVYAKNN